MGEKLSKLGITDYESFTISKYLKKLLEKFIITDNKETLSKPQLKQIYRIIDAYISPKKGKKELKMKKRKINNINQETNKNSILYNAPYGKILQEGTKAKAGKTISCRISRRPVTA